MLSVRQMNTQPTEQSFVTAAKEAFSFMPKLVSTEARSTYYSATFASKLIKLSVSYDIRDALVDCTIEELRDTSTGERVDLPLYCDLYGYLIDNLGYRGSLKEFRENEAEDPPWKVELNVYARAAQHYLLVESSIE